MFSQNSFIIRNLLFLIRDLILQTFKFFVILVAYKVPTE